jgi:hypothetical protein
LLQQLGFSAYFAHKQTRFLALSRDQLWSS